MSVLVKGSGEEQVSECLDRILCLSSRLDELLCGVPRRVELPLSWSGRVEVRLGEPFPMNCFMTYVLPECVYIIGVYHGFSVGLTGFNIYFSEGVATKALASWDSPDVSHVTPPLQYILEGEHAFYLLMMPRFIEHLRKHGYEIRSNIRDLSIYMNKFIEAGTGIYKDILRSINYDYDIARDLLNKYYRPRSIVVRIVAPPKRNKFPPKELMIEKEPGVTRISIGDPVVGYLEITPPYTSFEKIVSNKLAEIVENAPTYMRRRVIPFIKEYLLSQVIVPATAKYVSTT